MAIKYPFVTQKPAPESGGGFFMPWDGRSALLFAFVQHHAVRVRVVFAAIFAVVPAFPRHAHAVVVEEVPTGGDVIGGVARMVGVLAFGQVLYAPYNQVIVPAAIAVCRSVDLPLSVAPDTIKFKLRTKFFRKIL